MNDSIPIFPLNTILFPQGLLPLRIFEPRYIDMVGDCMRNSTGFGVNLIKNGQEVGAAATIVDIGTLGIITDFNQSPDGLLGITVTGQQRYRIAQSRVAKNGLRIGKVIYIENEAPCELPEAHTAVARLLEQILSRSGSVANPAEMHLDDAVWVGNRLAGLLPMADSLRQALLETTDPLHRLRLLEERMTELGSALDVFR